MSRFCSSEIVSDEPSPPATKSKKKSGSGKKGFRDDSPSSSSDEEPTTKKSAKSKEKSSDKNGKSKAGKSDAVDLPVTFNEYYRHKCKLASLKSGKLITGQVRKSFDGCY